MGVCAMMICVQRGVVVSRGPSRQEGSLSIKWRKVDLFSALVCGFTGFILVARGHELHLIILKKGNLIKSDSQLAASRKEIFLERPKMFIFSFRVWKLECLDSFTPQIF